MSYLRKKPVILMILDGFGLGEHNETNAIYRAKTPFFDSIFETCPMSTLGASGEDVGLPEGQMGNSEVGHLNIGSGRIVYQELSKITMEIETGNFFKREAFIDAMDKAIQNDKNLHLIGLLSDGGVHSHINHLKALLKMAKERGCEKVYVHGILDGRDVPPRCAEKYVLQIESYMKELNVGKFATISGRFYTMDRDNRWERVEKSYDAMVCAKGIEAKTAEDAIKLAYQKGEDDEFVVPTIIEKSGTINSGDSVIMYNFRPDRAREITRSIVDDNFTGFNRDKLIDITYVCMTQYDKTIENVEVAYPPENIQNTLGEILSENKIRQLRIAETEKYAHVTFFFNCGIEKPYEFEERILIPSPKVATYDLKPEMKAMEIADRINEVMDEFDVVIVNFANADMVGHTGKMDAAIKAIETLDVAVEKIVTKLKEADGEMLITADHGNADVMMDKEGNVVTAHSLNRVPLLYVGDRDIKLKKQGVLADIAPSVLDLLGIKKPADMTGESLIVKK